MIPKTPNYSSHQGAFYDKEQTTLIMYPAGKTESSFVIPNGVTTIGTSAFDHNSHLQSVIIPECVTIIRTNAFLSMDDGLTIYAMANAKPDGWESHWKDNDWPVIWGYTGE